MWFTTRELCYYLLKTTACLPLKKSFVICISEAWYIGCTTHTLAERIKQPVPMSIRKKAYDTQGQPPPICNKNKSKLIVSQRKDNTFLQIQNAPKHIQMTIFDHWASTIVFHLRVLESVYIKTQNPVLCRQKEFVFLLGLLK